MRENDAVWPVAIGEYLAIMAALDRVVLMISSREVAISAALLRPFHAEISIIWLPIRPNSTVSSGSPAPPTPSLLPRPAPLVQSPSLEDTPKACKVYSRFKRNPAQLRRRIEQKACFLPLFHVLDDMVTVLSSRSGRVSPLRSPGYLHRWKRQARSHRQMQTDKKDTEVRLLPPKEVFTAIYEAVQRPRTGRRLYDLIKALGYDIDQQLFYLLLETYIRVKQGQELTCEDWLGLLLSNSLGSKALPQASESHSALLSFIKFEVSKANSAFLYACSTWHSLPKAETGEASRLSAAHTLSDLYNIPTAEINEKVESLYGKGWTLSEEKYLMLLFPLILQRTLYEVGRVMYSWGLREGRGESLGMVIRKITCSISNISP